MSENNHRLAQYNASKDYKRLANLARKASIICLVDYRLRQPVDGVESVRDVARTTVQRSDGKEFFSISARGISYVIAFNEDEFILLCASNNVEFLEPAKEQHDEENA